MHQEIDFYFEKLESGQESAERFALVIQDGVPVLLAALDLDRDKELPTIR